MYIYLQVKLSMPIKLFDRQERGKQREWIRELEREGFDKRKRETEWTRESERGT